MVKKLTKTGNSLALVLDKPLLDLVRIDAKTPPAASLVHLVRNYPFLDGNTRVGLMATLNLLGLSGLRLKADPRALGDLVLGVAEDRISRAEVAVFLERHVQPARRAR